MQFQFNGTVSAPRVTVDDKVSTCLADALENLAAVRMTAAYDSASQRLGKRIETELTEHNRSVVVARDQTKQALLEVGKALKVLKIDILQYLNERSGNQYARRPIQDDVVH